MFRRFSINFAVFSILLDMALIAGSFSLSVLVRPTLSGLPMVAHIPKGYSAPPPLYFLFPLVWVGILIFASVYDGRRNLRFWKELATLAAGSAVSITALAGILFLSYRDLSRAQFILFVITAFAALLAWRVLVRVAYNTGMARSVQRRNVLVVGAGDLGREVAAQVLAYHALGLHLAGYLDDDAHKQNSNPEILGDISAAPTIIEQHKVEDVIIALPPRAYQEVFSLVSELHTLPVRIWVIPDYFKLALHKTAVEEFAGLPMLNLRAPALSESQRITKRVFDLLVALVLAPLYLPVMAVIALLIRLDSPGPVFFRQGRAGENGKIFQMLKFRTMVPNAENLRSQIERRDEHGNLVHKIENDPRVTRVGRFLRRYSLDEIPQIFNIIKGEMSLVGPRPELPYLVQEYQSWQRRRFSVPQGLTGWWQVNGRSDRPLHMHTEDDLYYIENYSIYLDILILLKTIGVVLRHKGAF